MANNSILGKLIADKTANAFDNEIRNILYTEIKPSSKNKFLLTKIDDLAEDIRENGLDHNIVVREIDDPEYKYEIVAGERRYTAICQNIANGDNSYKFIPAKIQRYDDENAEKRLILNNLQSRVITPSEMLESIESLQRLYQADKEKGIKLPGRVRELIADDLGIGTTQVGTYQNVSKNAIPEVKEMLTESTLTLSEASELAKLDQDDQLMFIQENDTEDITLQTIKDYRESLEENVSVTDTNPLPSLKDNQSEKVANEEQILSDDEIDEYVPSENVSVTDTNQYIAKEDFSFDDEEDYDGSTYDYGYDDEESEDVTITGLIETITKDFSLLETKIKGVEFKEERLFLDDAVEQFKKFKISLGIND